jgi:UDP-glucose 4-epimerase
MCTAFPPPVCGSSISIFGDGRQTRDFVYVADAVAALMAAMKLRAGDAHAFNVCTGIPTSVETLAYQIADLCGRPVRIRRQPNRMGEIRHSLGDPSLADRVLGLQRRTALRDGLGGVLAWLAGSGRAG